MAHFQTHRGDLIIDFVQIDAVKPTIADMSV